MSCYLEGNSNTFVTRFELKLLLEESEHTGVTI